MLLVMMSASEFRRIHSTTVLYLLYLLVFFFQAEDGIRDVAVTGVQTCALPILIVGGPIARAWPVIADDLRASVDSSICRGFPSTPIIGSTLGAQPTLMGALSLVRSEERRVGKECRSRWSPYH